MYNRYIPQPDGSYQKSRMEEPDMDQQHFYSGESPQKKGSFLERLFQGIDGEDLLIVLLLLLLAGEDPEEKTGALLTAAFYLLL